MSELRSEAEHLADEFAADAAGEGDLSPNERILLAAFKREAAENGRRPVAFKIDWGTAWALLATVQLACRHPNFNGPTRQIVEGFGRELQRLIAVGPACAQLAEEGWSAAPFDESPEAEEAAGL